MGSIDVPTIWLQVIWCIGICMIVLAALIALPRWVLLSLGLLIVCGHNLLDAIHLRPDQPLFPIWAMLHQRDVIALPIGLVSLENSYGDAPRFVVEDNPMRTAMSFFALTKHPPSLLFLLLTLGCGALLLALFERLNDGKLIATLAVFGGAPIFFYLFHLPVLPTAVPCRFRCLGSNAR